jgi:hypothetical protein
MHASLSCSEPSPSRRQWPRSSTDSATSGAQLIIRSIYKNNSVCRHQESPLKHRSPWQSDSTNPRQRHVQHRFNSRRHLRPVPTLRDRRLLGRITCSNISGLQVRGSGHARRRDTIAQSAGRTGHV